MDVGGMGLDKWGGDRIESRYVEMSSARHEQAENGSARAVLVADY